VPLAQLLGSSTHTPADDTKGSQAFKYIVLAVYVVLSLVAMRYLCAKQRAVRKPVVCERRKYRQTGKPGPSTSELRAVFGLHAYVPSEVPPPATIAPVPAHTAPNDRSCHWSEPQPTNDTSI
jgi:hypothetical protein